MQNGLLADVLVKYMLHEDNVNLARTSDPEVSERSVRGLMKTRILARILGNG